jgi:hypothetical protein
VNSSVIMASACADHYPLSAREVEWLELWNRFTTIFAFAGGQHEGDRSGSENNVLFRTSASVAVRSFESEAVAPPCKGGENSW